MFKTKPKKLRNKIWLETLNNGQNTNKIRKKNLQYLLINQLPLRIFDPEADKVEPNNELSIHPELPTGEKVMPFHEKDN
ncbi:22857_t:CDS:2 [Gigaspora rosea]|nr:22857_t:CDS:2 [Gigaspora rosea]